MTQTFPDTRFLDNYDYRIWHESQGITFYQDVSIWNFTHACSFLWLLQYFDHAKGITYTNQGLQVTATGTEDWIEFQFDDGCSIKDQMHTRNTQSELI